MQSTVSPQARLPHSLSHLYCLRPSPPDSHPFPSYQADIGYSVHTSSLAQHAYFNAAHRQIGPGKNDIALFTVVPATTFKDLLAKVGYLVRVAGALIALPMESHAFLHRTLSSCSSKMLAFFSFSAGLGCFFPPACICVLSHIPSEALSVLLPTSLLTVCGAPCAPRVCGGVAGAAQGVCCDHPHRRAAPGDQPGDMTRLAA